MASDVRVAHVTFSARELGLRLNQRWDFLAIRRGAVVIDDEPIAAFEKRGPTVTLRPIAEREAVRWVAWAIQAICPDSEAEDDDADPSRIVDPPMDEAAAAKIGENIEAARRSAIAKEADPTGGGHEAVALVTYLVKRELLELCGPVAPVARAVVPILKEIDDTVGGKLEDALLDLDEVEELFADGDELARIVQQNEHIFG